MAKKKNAGSYARGAVPRRSADRKAGHALRLFLKEESENETLFWKCHNYGDNFDGPCPAGLYQLVGCESLQHSILGAQKHSSAGVRTCDMLLCGDYEEAGRHRSQNQQKRRIID